MNFCVTDGETVVATRYISSRTDEAASLVSSVILVHWISCSCRPQWFSSGSTFSEYAEGGHYKMSKTDKRENIIMVPSRAIPPSNSITDGMKHLQIASEPLTFEKGALRCPVLRLHQLSDDLLQRTGWRSGPTIWWSSPRR